MCNKSPPYSQYLVLLINCRLNIKTMKNILLFVLFIRTISISSQDLIEVNWGGIELSLENTYEYVFLNISNDSVWKIMEPEKDILYLPTGNPDFGIYAIITDTSLYYRRNLSSYFNFKLRLSSTDKYTFKFYHKYDFEENIDGGIIETSYDDGETWQNILIDENILETLISFNNLYSEDDTISSYNGSPGFTGTLEELTEVTIQFEPNEYIDGETMLLRFTISSDSVDSEHEGWMIDFFSFNGGIQIGIEECKFSHNEEIIAYNSSMNIIQFRPDDINDIWLYSIDGKLIMNKKDNCIKYIDITNLSKGLYFIICLDKKHNLYSSKLIKQ